MAPFLNAGFAHLPGVFRSLAADALLPPAPECGNGRRPLLWGATLLAAGLRRRWLALTLLLALLVLTTAVDVAFTEGNGAGMDALNVRSAPRFWGTAAGLIGIYLLTLPVEFLNTYGQQRFSLAWRDRTTNVLSAA